MARILTSLLLVLAVAIPAIAAEPESGSVSGAAPETAWVGGMDGDPTTGLLLAGFADNGGTMGYCEEADVAAVCDVYTLTVTDPGTKLSVTATADDDIGTMAVEILPPAGGPEPVYVYDFAVSATATVENPTAGEYTINVLGAPNFPLDVVTYTASAKLEGAAAPQPSATATPTPPPPAPPPADPEPQPEPQPAPPAPAPAPAGPAPPAQAGPRSLALQPDRRRLRTAVRFGFRTRMVCHGGCTKVKVRIYVSRLTARNLRLGNFAGDVEVGSARVLRNAEGRRQAVVTFRPSLRKRLVRAKRLPLAIEAVATDPDGRVRTHLKRFTLRR